MKGPRAERNDYSERGSGRDLEVVDNGREGELGDFIKIDKKEKLHFNL